MEKIGEAIESIRCVRSGGEEKGARKVSRETGKEVTIPKRPGISSARLSGCKNAGGCRREGKHTTWSGDGGILPFRGTPHSFDNMGRSAKAAG